MVNQTLFSSSKQSFPACEHNQRGGWDRLRLLTQARAGAVGGDGNFQQRVLRERAVTVGRFAHADRPG